MLKPSYTENMSGHAFLGCCQVVYAQNSTFRIFEVVFCWQKTFDYFQVVDVQANLSGSK